jgi:hypothetical protein
MEFHLAKVETFHVIESILTIKYKNVQDLAKIMFFFVTITFTKEPFIDVVVVF